MLLWGPPGSGKTATVMLMARDVITQGGIMCQIKEPTIAGWGLSMIRKIEPDRPIVAVIEDIDALIENHGEHPFLALLDGEAQVDNICFVATTNYPEKLDKRFVDRPSRFDTIRWIGMPTAPARQTYLATKEPSLSAEQLAEWVAKTEGFSIAHLRELVILVQCFGRPLTDALAQLEKMRTSSPKSTDAPDKPTFGFGGGPQGKRTSIF
jgi:SpoVK/Ycf46/Vps4 family AAA+-type ATPase